MYDRAERGTWVVTNDNPGPGTYTISSDRDYREDNVPFKFKVGHVSYQNTTKSPAPNVYTIQYRKHRIKGAAWSKMTEKKPFVRYNEEKEVDDGENNILRSCEEARNSYYWLPELDKPKLYKGRPKKYLMADAEDPTRTQTEINLKKYYTRTYEDTMKNCAGCDKYRGSSWSKYRAARFPDKLLNSNPGPGDYNIEGEGPSEESKWLESIRFYKRATAKLERFTDQVECEQARNDEPSPADTAFSPNTGKQKSFNVKGTFGNPKKQICVDEGGPSPLDYNPYHAKCTISNRKKPPFNVSSQRREKIPDLPGPADYNPPQGTISFKLCKKLPPSTATYVAPFGTTDIQRPLVVDQGIPDPGTYYSAYRNTVHATIGETPANMLLKKKPFTSFDRLLPSTEDVIIRKQISMVQQGGRRNLNLIPEDEVWVKDYRNDRQTWTKGKVVDVVGNQTFLIKTVDEQLWRRHSDQIWPGTPIKANPVQELEEPTPEQNPEVFSEEPLIQSVSSQPEPSLLLNPSVTPPETTTPATLQTPPKPATPVSGEGTPLRRSKRSVRKPVRFQ